VRAKDALGNTSGWGTHTVIIDTTAPGVPSPTTTTPTTDRTPTWTWNAVSGNPASYDVQLNSGSVTNQAGRTYTPSSNLSDGSHTIKVRAKDALGNTSGWGSHTVVIDSTAPGVPSPTATTPTMNTTITWTWSTPTGNAVEYEVKLNGVVKGKQTTLNYTASGLNVGQYKIEVRARDAIGNWSGWGSHTVTIDPTPTPTPWTTPIQVARFCGDNSWDDFGREVAISKNGKVVAVGQYFSEYRSGTTLKGDALGSVTVYGEDSNGNWNQLGSTFEGTLGLASFSGDKESRMGYDVKLNGDGTILIITQPYLNAVMGRGRFPGDIYVYKWNGSSWDLRDNFWGEQYSYYGKNIDISENGNIIVHDRLEGTNRSGVVIREWNGTSYTVIQELGNRTSDYGRSISISGDGSTIAIGQDGFVPNLDGQYRGVGHVYKRNGSEYTINGSFYPTGATDESNSNFSFSCSLNFDGSVVAFGAPYGRNNGIYVTSVTGKAYVYKYINNNWTQIGGRITGNVGQFLGYSISLSDSGNELIVGEPRFSSGRGISRVYKLENNSWTQKYLISGNGYNIERTGTSVAMIGNSQRVIVGSIFAQITSNDFKTPGCVGIWDLPPY
jgi:hypothetical protein